jgi:transposase-like protein
MENVVALLEYILCLPRVHSKDMYTTNAVESIHSQIRQATKSKGAYPNKDAALKALILNLQVVEKRWTSRVSTGPVSLII